MKLPASRQIENGRTFSASYNPQDYVAIERYRGPRGDRLYWVCVFVAALVLVTLAGRLL